MGFIPREGLFPFEREVPPTEKVEIGREVDGSRGVDGGDGGVGAYYNRVFHNLCPINEKVFSTDKTFPLKYVSEKTFNTFVF